MKKSAVNSRIMFLIGSLLLPQWVMAEGFSMATQVEASSNLYSEGQYEHSAGQSLTLAPSYKWAKNWATSGSLVLNREAVSPHRTFLGNTPISISYTGYKLGIFDLKDKLFATLPTHQESVESSKYQGSMGVGADLSVTSDHGILPNSYVFGLAMTRNFHEYTQNNDGDPNIQNSVKGSLELGWELTSHLNLSVSGAYSIARTYEEAIRNKFSSSTTLAYDISKSLNIYGGTSTGDRAAFKSNGIDSNMTLFDENNSEIFAGLTYLL